MSNAVTRTWVNLQLALGNKTVDGLLGEAVDGDNAPMLAVLLERPETGERAGRLLEMSIQKGSVSCFKLLAGTIGEDKLNEALGKGGDVATLIVASGSTLMIAALAELGFNIHAPNAEGKTIAYLALEAQKTDLFRYVISAIREQDLAAQKDGRKKPGESALNVSVRDVPTVMELAIRERRLEEVKLLLRNGASANLVAEDLSGLGRIERMRRQKALRKGYLQMAIESQRPEIVEALADAGADLNPPVVCLLEVGMGFPDMSIVKMLARRMGKDAVNAARDSVGNNMLNRAVLDNNLPMTEFFATWPGADLNQANFRGMTPIGEAANNHRLDLVDLLVKNGVSLNEPVSPQSRQTLLHSAVSRRDMEMARWLMARDVDVNRVDAAGRTALDLAVASQQAEFINLLLDSDKTDINSGATTREERAKSRVFRRPPLMLAVTQMLDAANPKQMEQMAEVVILLLDLGANINAQDSAGATALHLMAHELERMKAQWGARGDFAPQVRKVLKAMAKAGANPKIPDDMGRTAIDIARQAQAEMKMLFDSGEIEILPPPKTDHSLTETKPRIEGARLRFEDKGAGQKKTK